MNAEASKKATLKEKAKHEGEELLIIFLYLAFFFCAVSTYSMLLLSQYQVANYSYSYAAALINALIVAKVILIGEYVHLGKKHESKPLLLSAVYKAILFSLLVFGFHILEEVIKRLIHGASIAAASRDIRVDELLARSVVIFCTFVPLFAFRELRRVIGDDEFRALFLGSRKAVAAKSELPGRS